MGNRRSPSATASSRASVAGEAPVSSKTSPAKKAGTGSTGGKQASVKKRAPGRPAREVLVPRDSLLDAAVACFVRKGIAVTSLRDIAVEAKVTPALLHYYFGDKAALVDAFVGERMLPVLQGVHARVRLADDDVAATIAAFIGGLTEAMGRYSWFPQLWVREMLCDGGALRDLLLTPQGVPQIARLIAGRFAAAQSRGEMNPDLDPRLLMTSLIGLTLFPAAGAPIWRHIFDADDLGLDDLRMHAMALLDRGLELKP